jgi:hypothetical protein
LPDHLSPEPVFTFEKGELTTLFYKPNFCCHCGETIDRVDWPLKASRRFCDVCQSEHLVFDWTSTILVLAMALIAVFAIGSALRLRAAPSPPRPVLAAPKKPANANLPNVARMPANTGQANAEAARKPSGSSVGSPVKAADESAVCGAPTKKGTPCTRRVREGGRCWQHRE